MSGGVPAGFVLMPKRVTPAMAAVMADADWTWAELLAAANAINKEEHAQLLAEPPTLDELQAQLNSALNSLAFYRRRCEAMQQWQSKMRDCAVKHIFAQVML